MPQCQTGSAQVWPRHWSLITGCLPPQPGRRNRAGGSQFDVVMELVSVIGSLEHMATSALGIAVPFNPSISDRSRPQQRQAQEKQRHFTSVHQPGHSFQHACCADTLCLSVWVFYPDFYRRECRSNLRTRWHNTPAELRCRNFPSLHAVARTCNLPEDLKATERRLIAESVLQRSTAV